MKYIYKVYEINRLAYTGDGRKLLNECEPHFLPKSSTAFRHSSQTKLVGTSKILPIKPLCKKKKKAISWIKVIASTVCAHDDTERPQDFKEEEDCYCNMNTSNDFFIKSQESNYGNQEVITLQMEENIILKLINFLLRRKLPGSLGKHMFSHVLPLVHHGWN